MQFTTKVSYSTADAKINWWFDCPSSQSHKHKIHNELFRHTASTAASAAPPTGGGSRERSGCVLGRAASDRRMCARAAKHSTTACLAAIVDSRSRWKRLRPNMWSSAGLVYCPYASIEPYATEAAVPEPGAGISALRARRRMRCSGGSGSEIHDRADDEEEDAGDADDWTVAEEEDEEAEEGEENEDADGVDDNVDEADELDDGDDTKPPSSPSSPSSTGSSGGSSAAIASSDRPAPIARSSLRRASSRRSRHAARRSAASLASFSLRLRRGKPRECGGASDESSMKKGH